ncbi:hypothetical protein KQI61_21395 [Anaerocolumna aminovalerica]|uniref:hypothetical protein n=1 Tax=Anaerocolumna aminovalerica TaxID=1527 RepID=UPI001C0EEB06|nr:hypothetical protein [Anaerocolumna aminovalerica]MBU5334722.1 hypothetical protein [Anaerocolumna aminovalerica]
MSEAIQKQVLYLGTCLQGEIYEIWDNKIRESVAKKKHWTIERRQDSYRDADCIAKGKTETEESTYHSRLRLYINSVLEGKRSYR